MDKRTTKETDKDLFGLEDLASQVKGKDKRTKFFHENFHLPWNPFPEPGVPSPQVTSAAPIRASVAKKIGRFIIDAYREPFKTKILVVKGQYGSGKSLILKRVVSLVNDSFSGKGEKSVKAIYVGKPSFEAHDLNRAVLESLGMDDIRKMIWIIIKKELAEDIKTPSEEVKTLWRNLLAPNKKGLSTSQGTFLDNGTIPQQLFSSVFSPENIDDYRTFLSKYDRQGWNRTYLRKYFTGLLIRGIQPVSTAGVLDAYVDLLLSFDDKEAWDSLLGMQAKKLSGRANFALKFLEDLLNILYANGFAYLFLVIDEFEQITEDRLLTARDRADYAYTMMEVINTIDKGLGIIIGITPDGFNRLSGIATPLADRLMAPIELKALDTAEIKTLIQYYLDEAREEGREHKKDVGKPKPFSAEAVETLANEIRPIALGATPRNVLQYCYNILEYCFEHHYTDITAAVVKEFTPTYREMKAREVVSNRRRR